MLKQHKFSEPFYEDYPVKNEINSLWIFFVILFDTLSFLNFI